MFTGPIIACLLYFSAILLISFLAHKKQEKAEDFIMGDRSLNYWITALSAHASDMSSWLFMAFPMMIFTRGVDQVWIGIGLAIGMFLNWQFVAPKLRLQTESEGSLTISSFFESKFKDTSGAIRLISGVAITLFMTHYVAAGLTALGFFFESLFGLNYHIGLVLAGTVLVMHTGIGGFVAVAWTDFFQGMFLLAMIILVPFVAFSELAPDAVTMAASAKSIGLSVLPDRFMDGVSAVFLGVAWGLGYFGMPHVLTKFMGIQKPEEITKAKWLGISWQALSLTAATFVGIAAIGMFPDGLDNPELVFVEMVQHLFPSFLGSLVLCGVLAATLSTMDSQILVASSTIGEDLYKKTVHPGCSDSEALWASRLGVILVVIIGVALAWSQSSTVYETVFYAWTGLGSTFGPVMLVALHGKRIRRRGVIAGMIVGLLVSALWPEIAELLPVEVPGMLAGFVLNLATIFGVSRLSK